MNLFKKITAGSRNSNLIDNILNEEEISKIEDPKEKEEEVAKRLEEIFSQMIKDKNKEKEENDEE